MIAKYLSCMLLSVVRAAIPTSVLIDVGARSRCFLSRRKHLDVMIASDGSIFVRIGLSDCLRAVVRWAFDRSVPR